jgi:hypothetical protein
MVLHPWCTCVKYCANTGIISFPATRPTSRTYSSEPDSIEQQVIVVELRSEVDDAGDEAADERVDAVRKTAARLVGKPDTVGRRYVTRRSQRRALCGLPQMNGESSLR